MVVKKELEAQLTSAFVALALRVTRVARHFKNTSLCFCRTGRSHHNDEHICSIKKASTREAFFYEMVRPARFERATARFVAEYSIQLSYGRVVAKGTDLEAEF